MPAFNLLHQAAMTGPEREPLARGAVAGLMLLASLLLCGAIGGLVGALTGAVVVFLILGVFVGFIAGIAAVRARFPDL